jgi:glycosyltransferase involved in cell wall biosynthesis
MARASGLVHCTGWDSSLWGRLAAGLARRPVVVTEHTPGRDTQISRGGAPPKRLIAWHNRVLDPITAATVVVAERQRPILGREGVRAEKIVHIPNGVPLDELRNGGAALSREALGLGAGAQVVVHVARFMPQKRQELTYATMRAVRERSGDLQLLFVGDGPGRAVLERRAREDGADWVSFLGIRHDVPALLGLADLAVLPSSAEALPMVVLEALGAGVPQVVTDVGDLPAVLARGGGLVVSKDDPGAFEDACAQILRDPELAARLRREALARAEELDTGPMTDRYSKLFDAVLAGGPPR